MNIKELKRWKVTLGVFTVFILITQTIIINKQIEILKESSVSNKPEIIIWSSQGLVTDGPDPLAKGGEESIAVGVTNIGKVMIPHTTIRLARNSFFDAHIVEEGGTSVSWQLTDLESLSYNATFFRYKIKPEYLENFEFGKVYKLDFVIDCPICKKPRDIQSIKICLFEQNARDCGDEWIN